MPKETPISVWQLDLNPPGLLADRYHPGVPGQSYQDLRLDLGLQSHGFKMFTDPPGRVLPPRLLLGVCGDQPGPVANPTLVFVEFANDANPLTVGTLFLNPVGLSKKYLAGLLGQVIGLSPHGSEGYGTDPEFLLGWAH